MEPPDTKYAPVHGARIAYQVFGAGASTLLMMEGSFSHTDAFWEDPGAAAFLERLGSFTRVVRYDHLGMSNSDPFPADLEAGQSFEAELDAILDRSTTEPVALLATLDGGPAALSYAAGHPDRIQRIILINTLARFLRGDGYPYGFTDDEAAALLRLYSGSWGDITPTLLAGNIPSKASDPAFAAWYAKLARMIGTPSAIGATLQRALSLDAREALPRITQPTLVLHRSAFRWIPIEHGRYLADHITGARFVELPGADGPFYYEAADLVLDALREFLDAPPAPSASWSELLTVLHVEVAHSSNGDWRGFAASEVARAAGQLVKFTGDGMLATFTDPERALECALQLRTVLQRMDVPIRAGLHTGQVNIGPDDVDGLAVHIAARVMAAAGDGRVAVSRTVHDLLLGSSYRFNSLGPQSLKGIEGEWGLFETLG